MNCATFGNVGKISKNFGINIIWHYFINNHGKNYCDTEFSRFKTKLDYFILSGEIEGYKSIDELHQFCNEFLTDLKWTKRGKISEREFFLRKVNPAWTIFKRKNRKLKFETFDTATDTKLYRCVAWNKEGEFFRRYNSCHCFQCVCKPNFTDQSNCELQSTLPGMWESYEMEKIVVKKNKNPKEKK